MAKITHFDIKPSVNGGFVVEVGEKVGPENGQSDYNYYTYTFKSVAQVVKAIKEAFPKEKAVE